MRSSRRTRLLVSLLLLAGALSGGCRSTAHRAVDEKVANAGLNLAPVVFPVKLPPQDGFTQSVFQAGPVFIAGQPSEAALERMVHEGVTLVVNVRTPEEMDDRKRVPFDEVEVMKRLKVDYLFLPMGGASADMYPYTPEAVDKFAAALASHKDGKVLLHCQVGWRVSHVWAAYLVRCRGFTREEAMRHGKAMLLTELPFEGLAGLKAEYVPAVGKGKK
ncbi:MAG: sulfur transferase domain-containing protein [Planctomycetota bacterium]